MGAGEAEVLAHRSILRRLWLELREANLRGENEWFVGAVLGLHASAVGNTSGASSKTLQC